MAAWTELWAHSSRGTELRLWTFIMPTRRSSLTHEMTAASGATDFGAVFFERDVAGSDGYIPAHDVGSAEAGERLPDGHLGDAFLGGVQNEIANEEPESILHMSVEERHKRRQAS